MPKKGLPEQKISVNMFTGLDTKTDVKLTQKLTVNKNVRYQKGGTASKRYGAEALSKNIEGGGTISNGVAVFTFEKELLQVADNKLYSYLESSKTWANRGNINSFSVNQESVIRNSNDQWNPSSGYSNDVTIRAWQETAGVKYNINSGDAKVVTDVLISSTAINPKVKANDGIFHIYYQEGTNLKVRIISALSPTLYTDITLQTDSDSNAIYDIEAYGSEDFLVAYKRTSTVLTMLVTSAGEVGSVTISRPNPISLARDGVNNIKVLSTIEDEEFRSVIITGNDTNQINVDILDELFISEVSTTLATVVSLNKLTAVERPNIANNYIIMWDESVSSTTTSKVRGLEFQISGAIATPTYTLHETVKLASHAFSINNDILVNTVYVGFDDPVLSIPLQTTNFIINETGAVELKINYGEAIYPTTNTQLPSFATESTTSVDLPLLIVDRTELSTTTSNMSELEVGAPQKIVAFTSSGIHSLQIKSGSDFFVTTTEHSGVLHINSGNNEYYDGIGLYEAGFNIYPENISIADGSDVTTITAGEYPFVVTYDFLNNKGRNERSFASTIVTHTTAGSVNMEITVPTLKLTKKQNVKVRVWRAQASTGINYHLVGEVDNDPSMDTVTISDTLPDTGLLTKEFLYTTGGILPNEGFPASSLGSASQERFWFQISDKPNTLGYTKFGRDSLASEWNTELVAVIPSEGGDLTALSASEESTVVFRERQIYYIIGQGQDNRGQFLTNLDIRKVQSDVGCINPKTKIEYKEGTAFLSAKGFRLLTPQLFVDDSFEVVEEFDNLTYTSAVVIPDHEEIRWTSLEGTTLVYNYYWKLWSTNTNQEAVGATTWDNKYVYLRPDGTVMVENKDLFFDDGVPYSMTIKTGSIRLNGIAGFGRLWDIDVLGNYRSPHIFRMDLFYNDEDYITESKFWYPDNVIFDTKIWGLESEIWGLESEVYGAANAEANGVFNFSKKPRKRRCNSVQIQISDIPGTGTGEGFEINILTLTVGIREGGRRHGKNRQF